MRNIFDRPEESQSIGRKACQDMQTNWQWSKAATMAAERMQKIGSSPVQATQNMPRKHRIPLQWEGSQFVYHSLALVNRELCLLLANHENLELSLIPYEPQQFTPEEENGRYRSIENCLNKPLSSPAQIHIRHRWPPDFNPPLQGHWVMMQPWEFGALPTEWVGPMQNLVDELWVPSNYVREVFIQSGISPSKVVVIPNGVNYDFFHPDMPPYPLETRKSFKYLFVGGTLWRKGIDVLLDAYAQAFTSSDDVCLVIKDVGGQSFYKGKVADARIQAFQENPSFPEILFMTQNLKENQLPGLYTACNCLVHPYRGEGFGLPVAEAMACGLPVAVTRGGACDDFCDSENAYLISGSRRPIHLEGFQLVNQGWVLEPDKKELVRILKELYENADAAATKGRMAARSIRSKISWEASAELIVKRINALKSKPILRFQNQNILIRKTPISAEFEPHLNTAL